MSQNVSLSKDQKVKVTLSPSSKLTAKNAEWEVVSGDCTLEDDEEDKTAKYIVASESVGQSIIKVSGKIHVKKEPGEGGEEGEATEEGGEEVSAAKRGDRERRPKATPYGEEGAEGGEEEEEETGEELIYVDVTDPNSSALGVTIGTPEAIEEEEEEGAEGGEPGAPVDPDKKKRKKKDRGRKKPKR
jgi:hypothetical protein